MEQEALDKYEVALNEVLPQVFAIVKDTARRFAENEETVVTATDFDRELASNPANDFVTIDGDKAIYHNHWTAGGNDMKWEMIHYDVQLFGGVVLHQGKIAEMATGEGKTLVGTTPIFLNALTGNGVHVVTVNDYLAKRDSEWMGPLYMFHGLSVDCIDKHRPNSDERRKAYMADITFGTNNEFGFDYLRDNMATNPSDLVQRQHNYAIVDEVDSVLIDDARTPLIISGPIPKGDDQMFEQYQPLVEKLYEVQRKQATELLAEAKQKITEGGKTKKNQEVFKSRYIKIVYEDRYIIVIEKNVGILSMAAGHSTLNVKTVLDDYFHKTRQNCQAHVVHRLDRDTSGLMIYAKDKQTELALEDDWHHNVYDRRYVALVSGEMEEDEGTVANWLKDNKAYITYASDTDNGGKYAVTHFHTLQRTTEHSLVEYKLETGRKNQIRVHTADMGHPVCGDIKYGNGDDPCGRLCLHAYVLCFYHPVTHQPMEFETPIPNEFVRAMKEDSKPFDERGKKSFDERGKKSFNANRKPFRKEGRNG